MKGWLDFKLFSQAAHFDNDSNLMPKARVLNEPALNVPLSARYGSVNIETRIICCRYNQKQGRGQDAETVERSVDRVLPQIKADF